MEQKNQKKTKQAALFFDIDGTLYSEIHSVVPDSALEALRQAKANGHQIFINTGRTFCSLPPVLKQFPFDGYLCGCGTYVTYHDEVLFEKNVDVEKGQEIYRKMQECKVDGFFEGTEDVFFPIRVSRFDGLENTRRYFRNMGLGLEKFAGKDVLTFDKFVVYTDEKSDQETFFAYISKDMDVFHHSKRNHEIAPKGVSKGTACEVILKRLGMGIDQAYVFGDSPNDLSMMKYAGHAIVMEKHAEELDLYAEFVTKTVEDDGIAFAMKHYGFIE